MLKTKYTCCCSTTMVIETALAKGEELVKGAVKIIAHLTYRQRDERSTGRDPFWCPHCGAEMAVWRILALLAQITGQRGVSGVLGLRRAAE